MVSGNECALWSQICLFPSSSVAPGKPPLWYQLPGYTVPTAWNLCEGGCGLPGSNNVRAVLIALATQGVLSQPPCVVSVYGKASRKQRSHLCVSLRVCHKMNSISASTLYQGKYNAGHRILNFLAATLKRWYLF